MKSIKLRNITKSFGEEEILENFNLDIPSGKFFALLGPSGCGKTTILRLIAGFESPDSGKILLGGDDITNDPINERQINTVFQNYALYPHMKVFDNIAYGLKVKGIDSKIIEGKVLDVLKVVHLEAQIYKPVQKLSGGQQQRVALARAIINEPDVLLLDEPLAALDLRLREKVLLELKTLQKKLKTTFVYVTHDQFEALTVANQMAIMNHDGQIEQIDDPKKIYEFPKSAFVARFVGTTNIIPGIIVDEDKGSYIEVEHLGKFDILLQDKEQREDGSRVCLSLRPEKIFISKQPMDGFTNVLSGVVEEIVYHGRSTEYSVRIKNGTLLKVFEQNEEHFPKEVVDSGDTVKLYWQKENAVIVSK